MKNKEWGSSGDDEPRGRAYRHPKAGWLETFQLTQPPHYNNHFHYLI